MIRAYESIQGDPAGGNEYDTQPVLLVDLELAFIGYGLVQDDLADKIKYCPCEGSHEIVHYSIPGNRYLSAFVHQRVITLLPMRARIWWATSIAINPSISETMVFVLLSIALL